MSFDARSDPAMARVTISCVVLSLIVFLPLPVHPCQWATSRLVHVYLLTPLQPTVPSPVLFFTVVNFFDYK